MDPTFEREKSSDGVSAESAISQAPRKAPTKKESTILELGGAVGKIAAFMHPENGAISTGERAELRRISPDRPFTPALWRMLLTLDRGDSPGWIRQSEWERRWATLMMGLAFCAGLHDYHVPLGRALAEAGWSELRFSRLLRAEGAALEKHVRRVAQYLNSKSQKADWTDMARLLFYPSGHAGEEMRLSIARAYYRALYAQREE